MPDIPYPDWDVEKDNGEQTRIVEGFCFQIRKNSMPDKLEEAHENRCQAEPDDRREQEGNQIKDIGNDEVDDHRRLWIQRVSFWMAAFENQTIKQSGKISRPTVLFILMNKDGDEA